MLTNVSLSETDRAAVSVLRASVMKLARRLRNQRADETLSPTQLSVLTYLNHKGPLTPGELARHEKVQPPSMTRVVAGLEERGLVSRAPHPDDRRQVTVTVTDEAAEVVAESRRLGNAWLAQQLEHLSDDELAVLRAALPVLEKLAHA